MKKSQNSTDSTKTKTINWDNAWNDSIGSAIEEVVPAGFLTIKQCAKMLNRAESTLRAAFCKKIENGEMEVQMFRIHGGHRNTLIPHYRPIVKAATAT
jgi:hypothetical protein